MTEEQENLIIELADMVESGSIIVGALGLSQDSANYINKEYELIIGDTIKVYESKNKIKK